MLKGFALGVVAAFVVLAGMVYASAKFGWIPANADARPSRFEERLSTMALMAAIRRQASDKPNPVKLNDANLVEGVKLYAVNCAVCHGAADGKASSIARGLYQMAPQFAKWGVEDEADGDLYWMVHHGIRMTGMPSFRRSLSEEQIWKVVLFLKNMDKLPARPKKAWQALPSVAAPAASAK